MKSPQPIPLAERPSRRTHIEQARASLFDAKSNVSVAIIALRAIDPNLPIIHTLETQIDDLRHIYEHVVALKKSLARKAGAR